MKIREQYKNIVGAVPRKENFFLVFPRGKTPVLKMDEVYDFNFFLVQY